MQDDLQEGLKTTDRSEQRNLWRIRIGKAMFANPQKVNQNSVTAKFESNTINITF